MTPLTRSLVAAACTVAFSTGCVTHDRANYRYKPDPIRIKDPGLRQAPVNAMPDSGTPGPELPGGVPAL